MKIVREELILNTIAFKDELDKGRLQVDLLEQAQKLGLTRLEIRREYLADKEELVAIKNKADRLGLSLFYSVNEDFVIGDQVNPQLELLRQEAALLGAPFVKLNTGDASQISIKSLAELAPALQSSPGVRLENNQDPNFASLKNCRLMMDKVKEARLPITFVFDLANWVWLDEDVEQALASLAPATSYLHCKNYRRLNGQLQLASLFEGELDAARLIQQFPHIDYLALEYPASLDQLQADISQLLSL